MFVNPQTSCGRIVLIAFTAALTCLSAVGCGAEADPGNGILSQGPDITDGDNRIQNEYFSAAPAGGVGEATVTFRVIGDALDAPDSWEHSWNFGEGGSSTGNEVQHHFTQPGLYTVTLTSNPPPDAATSDEPIVSSLPIYILPNYTIETSGDEASALTVHFVADTLVNDAAFVSGLTWNFGDDTMGTGKSATHSYGAQGTYNVLLSFVVGALAINCSQTSITVPETTLSRPLIADAGSDFTVIEGEEVTLGGQANDSDPPDVGYSWTQLSGPVVTLSNPNNRHPTFVAPAVSESTDCVFQFLVSKADQTRTSTVRVTIAASEANDGILTVSSSNGLDGTGPRGGPFSPQSVIYTLINTGGQPLAWTATNRESWISLSASNGTLAPGASSFLGVAFNLDANDLALGRFTDEVTITNATSGNGDTVRSVSLAVQSPDAGFLDVTPEADFSSSGSVGGSFSPGLKVYTLTNLGANSIDWTASKTQAWTTLSATNGTLAGGATIDVSVSINAGANSLAAGNYADTVTFINSTNGDGDTTRNVALSVNGPAGALSVTPSTGLASFGNMGGPFTPGSQIYTLTNTGGVPINWTVSRNQTWTTLSATNGTLAAGATANVTVSINSGANSLMAGSYSDTVTFTNATNGTGNTSRSVALTINPSPGALSVTPTSSYSSSGNAGGPFSPSSKAYVLTNTGGTSINWTATKTRTWVTLSAASGTITAGANATVTVTINSGANALAVGSYSDTVTFTNSTNGNGSTTRAVSLTVTPAGSAQPMTTASRTSGVAPLAVFFDAVNATSPSWTSGVVQPSNGDFASYHYVWDFGDTAAGTWATNGRSKNAALGYVAAHVYETPGTYFARLSVTDAAGATHTYEQQITVQAFSGTTYYVSSSSGNDGNNGLSPATPFQGFSRAMTAVGTNTRVLFKRGDSWSISAGKTLNVNGPGIIGAYYNSNGTDNPAQPQPRITHTGNGRTFGFNPGNDDWRLMDLHLVGTAASTTGAIYYGNGTQSRSLCLRLNIVDACSGFESGWGSAVRSENFVVECNTSDIGSNSGGNHYFIYCFKMAIMGCTGYSVQLEGEHIVRIFHARKTYIADNDFGAAGSAKHVLKLHNDDGISPALPDGQYINVCHNKFVDGGGWIATLGPQDDSSNEHVSHILLEGNTLIPVNDGAGFIICASHVTARNNLIWGDGASMYFDAFTVGPRGIEGSPDNVRIYNNTFYRGDNGQEFIMLRLSSSTNVYFANNLASAPNWSGQTKVLVNNVQNVPITLNANLLTNTPGFVNAAAGDFHLTSGSAALNQGISLSHVRADHDVVSRPLGSACDVGAFERP